MDQFGENSTSFTELTFTTDSLNISENTSQIVDKFDSEKQREQEISEMINIVYRPILTIFGTLGKLTRVCSQF